MPTHRPLLNVITQQKTSYLENILQGPRYILLKTILTRKIEGKKGPGRSTLMAPQHQELISQTLSL
jgi:hypothetical protein